MNGIMMDLYTNSFRPQLCPVSVEAEPILVSLVFIHRCIRMSAHATNDSPRSRCEKTARRFLAMILQTLLALFYLVPAVVFAQSPAASAYAPTATACPSGTPLVRQPANRINAQEAEYIASRKADVLARGSWINYINFLRSDRLVLPTDVTTLLAQPGTQPTLGLAVSGGSYRAAIFGAGVLDAIDSRNPNGLGGLLQASSYIAGLSGGSWLVLSLANAELPRLPNLTQSWRADEDIIFPDGIDFIEYAVDLIEEIEGKLAAGYPVTFVDVWSRALSRHFVNSSDFFNPNALHGAGITLSGLMQLPSFQQRQQPFPIVVADSLTPDVTGAAAAAAVPLGNTIFEFNPFEFGSFDPTLNAFEPMVLLGSVPGKCVNRFDQLSFIEGTSSNFFNFFNASATTLADSPIASLLSLLEDIIPERGVEAGADLLTAMIPDPFQPATNVTKFLRLVDGGEDGANDPLQPLLVHDRNVDVIIVADASADTADNFANGAALIASQARAALFPQNYSFPIVPNDTSTFLSLNLTRRPTFFGCNVTATNSSAIPPLIIYIANGGPPLGQSPVTNTPTLKLSYTSSLIDAMLAQTLDIATQGIPIQNTNGTRSKDPAWPVCLACGIVERSRAKGFPSPVPRSPTCQSCLQRYCFS
ncbi:hypothetical protein K474DRAFT_1508583 [Panus rudis PR-1116 ss-1]|nr:hypothetical protein K474DRAFT_1508583 [Panus rudis PR-1116 ss-1]